MNSSEDIQQGIFLQIMNNENRRKKVLTTRNVNSKNSLIYDILMKAYK